MLIHAAERLRISARPLPWGGCPGALAVQAHGAAGRHKERYTQLRERGEGGSVRGRILVVDDEPAILEVVRLNLEAEGYEVAVAPDAARGLAAFDEEPATLAILDVMLPDMEGFELTPLLRERTDMPIIMLSARDSDVDKAIGLGIGADDYVTKPFSPLELLARVKAHMRRYAASADAVTEAHVIEAGPVRLDLARRRATVRGDEVELTAKEFDIERLLAEHPGLVFTKAQIYDSVVDGRPSANSSTLGPHPRAPATLEEEPESPVLVTTVWGIGYRFEEGA